MERDLAEEAQQRAQTLGFTFSRYVVQLIRQDLAKRGVMIIEDNHAATPTPAPQPVTYPKPPRKKKASS